MVEDALPATDASEYVEKYRHAIAQISFDPDGFARAFSVALQVTPRAGRPSNPGPDAT